MSVGWVILDRDTGKQVSSALFLTRMMAEDEIALRQDRYDRGARQYSHDQLLRMDPAPLHRSRPGN